MASAHSVHASPADHHGGHAGRPPAVTAMILDPWTPSDSGHRPGIGAYPPVWPDSVPIALRTTDPNQAFVQQARTRQRWRHLRSLTASAATTRTSAPARCKGAGAAGTRSAPGW